MLSSPVLYARGPYRVIAGDPGLLPLPYVVVDTAGAWLREEASLETARAWIDHRVADRDAPGRRPGAPGLSR